LNKVPLKRPTNAPVKTRINANLTNHHYTALEEFSQVEKCETTKLMQSCRLAAEANKQADKAVQVLLASASFPKFVKLMKSKAKEMREKEDCK
jgi:hypothetical protein